MCGCVLNDDNIHNIHNSDKYIPTLLFILCILYDIVMMNMIFKVDVFRRCPEVLNFIPSCCVQT